MPRVIALVAGETAGHVYPALAVADAYRAAFDDVEVLFLGTADSAGARLVPRHGDVITLIEAAPMARRSWPGKMAGVVRSLAGTVQARGVLRQRRVRLVLGFGGFASGSVLFAARSLGIPSALHEANVFPGLGNRLVARLVDRAYLGFESAAPFFPANTSRVYGTPVRAAVAALRHEPLEPPAADQPAHLLVTSGSRGSEFLAAHLPALAGAVARTRTVEVWHQRGAGDGARLAEAYGACGVPARVVANLDEIETAYRWADIAISRAGAGTLSELAVAGLPALLVPLGDAAEDHQRENARAFAGVTGGCWVEERHWDQGVLSEWLVRMLTDQTAWRTVADRTRALARGDAAASLVADCERLMLDRW
jgi:UDP-N-acetylglucosamine--N-acetylmuramyl-(pentapeptide) pyrophosphoryl-undecaprenol N-acetylglucosamine transferase